MVDISNEYFKSNPKALNVFYTLTDIDNFKKNKTELAKEAGVSRVTLNKHLNDKDFMKMVNDTINEYLQSQTYRVMVSVFKNALEDKGYNDRKLFLEALGGFVPEHKVNTVTQIVMDLENETEEEREELHIKVHADDTKEPRE